MQRRTDSLSSPIRCRRRGVTLVEAIASIVVVSIALPPMLWSLMDTHRTRVDPVLATRARWLVAEKLEDIIADRHSLARGYAYVSGGKYPNEASVSGFTGFSRSVSIVETSADLASAGTGYKTVTVSVGWTNGHGQAQTYSLATVLTSYTP